MPRRTQPSTWFLLLVLASLGSPSAVRSQGVVRVTVDENFRREPNGTILGRLSAGASLLEVGRRAGWVEVDLEGWVWLASLAPDDTGELDLAVSAAGGENLRAAPRGGIVGRLEEGALLEELERGAQWARVRRRGWIWSASVDEAGPAAPTSDGAPSATGASSTGASPTSTEVPSTSTAPVGYARLSGTGSAILAAPDGDTVAVAEPRAEVEVVSREGSWARVRVEGWVWMPPAAAEPSGDDAGSPAALVPADLVAAPETHVGRVVSWTLQFISLERAEAVRTDFFEGEPFLLSRFGGPQGGFVYVAVPTERLSEVEGLVPLERIAVTGRVRTGASQLTGTPIVDLVTVAPLRGAR